MKNYRQSVYEKYISSRILDDMPSSLQELNTRLPYFKKIIISQLPLSKDIKILDLGCGHGAFLYALHRLGYENTIGVDVSFEQVALAKKLNIVGIIQSDLIQYLECLEFNSIDVVIAFDIIEHFSRDEIMNYLKLVNLVLKPGGKLILHLPNASGLFFTKNFYSDITHETPLNDISISQLLSVTNFSNIKSYDEGPTPHGIISFGRFVLWKLISLTLDFLYAVETGSYKKGIWAQNFLVVCEKK